LGNEIAIIGMAGRFPEADDLEALHRNLLAGRDSVRPLSEARRQRTALRPDRTYMVAGYLEDIDLFDPEIFGLSPAEAEEMDPHQRFLLEVTHQAIENAGYSPASFDGTNCAVFVGDAVLEYHRHAEEETPTLVTGNMKSFLSTHVARQFGLNGNAVVVDGACASSLIAVHLACNELLLGDAEFALACGVNLFLFPEQPANRLGVWSPDGKSRAFSAQADGMSRGGSGAAGQAPRTGTGAVAPRGLPGSAAQLR
jgi:acyl transferase domain-containing protein